MNNSRDQEKEYVYENVCKSGFLLHKRRCLKNLGREEKKQRNLFTQVENSQTLRMQNIDVFATSLFIFNFPLKL